MIAADTHVHLYPHFDLAQAFDAAHRNLTNLAPKADPASLGRVLLLTERHDCDCFADLKEGRRTPGGNYRMVPGPEPACLEITREDGPSLLLVAGRQVATAEHLEVLALGTEARVKDGLPIRETVDQVIEAGGFPVVPWSPGKWFFKRAGIVRGLLDAYSPGQIALGDSTLRPVGWPLPFIMRDAGNRRFSVIAGSDPLPLPGEDQGIGRYGMVFDAPLDREQPITRLIDMLRTSSDKGVIAGRRDNPLQVIYNLARLRKNNRL